MTTTIGERLAQIRGQHSQAAFASEIGVHKNTLGGYERGERTPDADFLRKLMEAGYNANWVISGEGQMHLPKSGRSDDLVAPGVEERGQRAGYDLVPLYDVRAAAGHGAVVEDEKIIDYLAFKREWLQQELHAGAQDLYLIEVDGESMEPTLRPGDVILVDRRSAQQVPRDGIYVLRMDGTLLVKRLQRLPERRLRLSSDNPAYQPFEIELGNGHSDDLAIIGRVVWTGRRM